MPNLLHKVLSMPKKHAGSALSIWVLKTIYVHKAYRQNFVEFSSLNWNSSRRNGIRNRKEGAKTVSISPVNKLDIFFYRCDFLSRGSSKNFGLVGHRLGLSAQSKVNLRQLEYVRAIDKCVVAINVVPVELNKWLQSIGRFPCVFSYTWITGWACSCCCAQ